MEEKNLVTLPNEVADYLESMRDRNYTLIGAFKRTNATEKEKKLMTRFFSFSNNQEKFALAWVNGYKREEKKFLVEFKGFSKDNKYLNMYLDTEYLFMSSRVEIDNIKTKFTKEELKKLGFDWVFNSEGVNIIEVEND